MLHFMSFHTRGSIPRIITIMMVRTFFLLRLFFFFSFFFFVFFFVFFSFFVLCVLWESWHETHRLPTILEMPQERAPERYGLEHQPGWWTPQNGLDTRPLVVQKVQGVYHIHSEHGRRALKIPILPKDPWKKQSHCVHVVCVL